MVHHRWMRYIVREIPLLLILCIPSVFTCGQQQRVSDLDFPFIDAASDSAKTCRSFTDVEGVDGMYLVRYYGDYRKRLEQQNQTMLNRFSSRQSGGECSLFTALGDADRPLYGRNFDNPECGVLIGLYQPPDGYASIAFSRLNDFGFDKMIDPDTLTAEDRARILDAPFFSADGMNACGVVTALAYLEGVQTVSDAAQRPVFVTLWIREILDHASNIDEAVAICRRCRVYDAGPDVCSHHILIGDASGRSVIVEYHDGHWRITHNAQPWQVVTNSPLFGRSEEERQKECWRYKKAFERLEGKKGRMTHQEGMSLLKALSVDGERSGTQWSSLFDIAERNILVALYRNHENLYRVSLPPSRLKN